MALPNLNISSNPSQSVVWVPCLPDYSTNILVPLYTPQTFPYSLQPTLPSQPPIIPRGGSRSPPWSAEEDETLLRLIKAQGIKNWAKIAKEINTLHQNQFVRKGKHCRERWCNHLDPEINKGEWSVEEDIILLKEQKAWGNRWSVVRKKLRGRTENTVKNRWKCLVKNARSEMNWG